MSIIRGKINTNSTLVELLENKVSTIGTTPSTTKYPTEKAVSDFVPKIYYGSSIPTSKSGDLILHQNATQASGGVKGKLKVNSSGILQEFVPDRTICDYRTASALSSTVLLAGELAIESDTGKMKIGNGSSSYSGLPYLSGSSTEPSNIGITYGGNAADAYDIQYQQGWIKMPNGMIMQWGLGVYASNGASNFDHEIYLPIAFSKKRIYSHGVLEAGGLWNNNQLFVHPRGIGTSSLRFTVEGGLSPSAQYELHWIAIGF